MPTIWPVWLPSSTSSRSLLVRYMLPELRSSASSSPDETRMSTGPTTVAVTVMLAVSVLARSSVTVRVTV